MFMCEMTSTTIISPKSVSLANNYLFTCKYNNIVINVSQIHVSVPLYKTLKKYVLQVPPVIIGLYKTYKLSISLPPWTLDFSIAGRHCK